MSAAEVRSGEQKVELRPRRGVKKTELDCNEPAVSQVRWSPQEVRIICKIANIHSFI